MLDDKNVSIDKISSMQSQPNQKQSQDIIEKDFEKLKTLVESYRLSAQFHAMRSQVLYFELFKKQEQVERLIHSFSWRITKPLRFVRYLTRGQLPTGQSLKDVKKRIIEIYQDEGYGGVYNRVKKRLPPYLNGRKKLKPGHVPAVKKTFNSDIVDSPVDTYKRVLSKKDFKRISPLILIVAEMTLPQCVKYRVLQKKEHFEHLGWKCRIVDWRETDTVKSLLQTCTEVIFYRVPGFESVMEEIEEAKRVGLSPWWEVDDLIFDRELYLQCGYMDLLPKHEKELLLSGAKLFRKAMLACDRGIASTRALASFMKAAGLKEVVIIENALDKETLRLAKEYHIKNRKSENQSDEVVILYGSGTKTHNVDFMIAAPGILAAMKKEPHLSLHIVGELELPPEFKAVQSQVKYIPSQPYHVYLGLLAKADIAIAPLEPIDFNDAKSNIKYLEASILGIPSVCSPQQAFTDVIRNDVNGLLAANPVEWEEALLKLARNKAFRKRIGEQAYEDVHERYHPKNIAETQVKPVFGVPQPLPKDKLRILTVNIYYEPYSFGGATLVAEELAKRLEKEKDVEVSIFTSRPFIDGLPNALLRYHSGESLVFSTVIPSIVDPVQVVDNIDMTTGFGQVLEAIKPDIVHFHSIQSLGLPLLRLCQGANIPYVVTLHDAWWLCERQFMVRADGNYCFQTKVDTNICQICMPFAGKYIHGRYAMMHQGLEQAALLLSPSESHRQLHIMNGIAGDHIKVNRNGIPRPTKKRPPRPSNMPLRFGFAAGDESVKGYPLIREVFGRLKRSDWQLKIVDSKVNLGYPPINPRNWGAKGEILTVLPYDKTTMDDFFYGIDVLLFPSRWKESYGMTVREALLRDVWVICSAPGGQSEDIMDGVNGTLISINGDADELQKAVEDLLDHSDRFVNYTNPHKDHIETQEQQAQELLGIFQQIKKDVGNEAHA